MTLIQQFAEFAATKSGPYQTDDDCRCPMAEFGRHLYPETPFATAGEETVTVFGPYKVIRFPHSRFFTKFVEPFSTWEELAAALRRAS